MTTNGSFQMRPDDVLDATRMLDELAGRADKLMQTETPNVTVVAPGRDEVSQRVASTLNDVQADFRKMADGGVGTIRALAATLRAHTDDILAAEQDFAV
jgi:PE family